MAARNPVSYGVVNVGLADSIVLPGDAGRLALQISNPGPNPVWIAWGVPAVANGAILIPPNSVPLTYLERDWPGLLASDLHAITTGAAGKLAGLSWLWPVT